MGRPWLYLLAAGLLEIAWALSLKYTQGFTRLWPSLGTLLLMAVSFLFLAKAVQSIPIGTAYAVWTGIGAAGTALCGIWFLGESAGLGRILSLFLIIAGLIGVKLYSGVAHTH